MKILDKIKRVKDISAPPIIESKIKGIINTLDETYGEYRNAFEDDGGYVILIEQKEDFRNIPRYFEFITSQEPELIDEIKCNGEIWLNVLYLLNNEFGVNVFTKKSWALKNIKNVEEN